MPAAYSHNRLQIMLILAALAAGPATAGARLYEARLHEARWEAGAEGLTCTLSHEIPHYGRVEFRRSGLNDMTLMVRVKRPPLLRTEAELSSDPPDWKHQVAMRELDPLEAGMSAVPFRISGARAQRVFTELQQGMVPSLRYQDWADGLDQVTVKISPVYFRTAGREFLDCQRDFSTFGMKDGGPTRVYFQVDSARLTDLGREVLEQAVRHLKKNRRGLVFVEGHASSEGEAGHNLSLSRKRAIVVRNYLMERGIPRSRFELHFLGETRPIASNATELGRIKNRRVELRSSQ